MHIVKHCLCVLLACGYAIPLHAAEGPSLAGPIGGTDIRSAVLPPPGLYGGGVMVPGGEVLDFVDGQGQPIPVLNDANIKRTIVAPFIGYVPNIDVLGGSIGFGAIVPYGQNCGHLFQANPTLCQSGLGDPYLEMQWSRFFGVVRPPRSTGALPIMQGLSIALGFGVVVPSGQYNSTDPTTRVLSAGSNIWDFAPHIAFTYTSAPILADGTEFSTKIYWNKYRTNPATQYSTGDLINIDFAVSERIGRFQVGVTGFYAFQVADDKQFGTPVPPDGQRVKLLNLGGVLAYDMPEFGAFIKIKMLQTVFVENSAHSRGIVLTFVKKLH
jgi:hypothetical protein